ncbi:MAG: zinc ribbon domain-containing protein [Clostridiales bacterium]|nr:zinc ribbon domain-containing protein [Clostridiales bacterium]MCF8021128.1 zinc ribbon domain-containing protein [Clostridiales bacterium]
MPSYDYKCKNCGQKFCVIVSIEDREKVTCPECKSKNVTQIITGCSINTGSCGGSTPSKGGG